MEPKLRAHVTEGIPSTHAKFLSNRLKIMQRREKQCNAGSDIDSCVQRQATKCYSVLNVRKYFG